MRRLSKWQEDVLQAWLSGATLRRRECIGYWKVWNNKSIPNVTDGALWEVNPEARKDYVRFATLDEENVEITSWDNDCLESHNLRLTFDGETGKLKKAEVI